MNIFVLKNSHCLGHWFARMSRSGLAASHKVNVAHRREADLLKLFGNFHEKTYNSHAQAGGDAKRERNQEKTVLPACILVLEDTSQKTLLFVRKLHVFVLSSVYEKYVGSFLS